MRGFTLVELLVAIGVLAVVGILILTIFARTLQGNNKSKITGVIKQNGQSVLEQMDKTVRNADNVVCPTTSTTSDNLVVVNKSIYTRYRFIAPSPAASPTSNGLIQQDNPATQCIMGSPPCSGSRYETDVELRDRICTSSDPMSQPATLTDTNTQVGVSVVNGLFTRDRSSGFRDQVTIKFDLKPGVGVPPILSGQIDTVTFQTTVGLR